METKAFLGMVLPGAGQYAAVHIDRDGPINPRTGKPYVNHKWCGDIQELAEFYERVGKRPRRIDCYHAMSSFTTGKRKQEFVYWTRSVWFDLDCGKDDKGRPKAFRHQRAALVALADFVDRHKLPVPLVVSSGYGIHAYWCFDRDLRPAEWQPIADALKAMAQADDFKIDAACTADSARILRTPGTINHKFGARMLSEVLWAGDGPLAPETLISLLSVPQRAAQGQSKAKGPDDFFGTMQDELPKAEADVIERGCRQVRAALRDPAVVSEPIWYRLMGLAAFTTGGIEVAQRWSKGHPEYDPKATLLKFNQWTMNTSGPPTCKSFAAENPEGCKGCPHKITTPVQIVPTPVSQQINGMPALRAPYFVKDGAIWVRSSKIDKGTGTPVATDELVRRTILYPVRYYMDPDADKTMVEWHWMDDHKTMHMKALNASVHSGNNVDFRVKMADRGIATLNEATGPLLRDYMHATYDDLLQNQRGDIAVSSMGWQDGFEAFALGGTLYTKDGTSPLQLSTNVEKLAKLYHTKGTFEAWRDMTGILAKHKMYAQQIAIGIGMASVLLPFTGLKGAVVSYFGATGTGKTTAENMQQSVWGDPNQLVRGAKTTANALYTNLALYGNLPPAFDETSKQVATDIGDMLYSISVGSEKERLNSDSRLRERRMWCLIAMLTGNQSLAGQLDMAGDSSDAQHRRLLEMELTPNPALAKSMHVGKKLQQLAYANYGHVAPLWIKLLLDIGEDGIRELIEYAMTKLPDMGYESDGTDRFRETITALVSLSLAVAREQNWVAFNPAPALRWMVQQISLQKGQRASEVNDHFDLVNLFLNQHVNATVRTTLTDGGQHNADVAQPMHPPRDGIVAAYEYKRATIQTKPYTGTVAILRDAFKQWLKARGTDLGTVERQLQRAGVLLARDDRVTLTKGTALAYTRQRCMILDLRHPRLEPELMQQNLRSVTGEEQHQTSGLA